MQHNLVSCDKFDLDLIFWTLEGKGQKILSGKVRFLEVKNLSCHFVTLSWSNSELIECSICYICIYVNGSNIWLSHVWDCLNFMALEFEGYCKCFRILIYTDVTRMEAITGPSVMITMECVSVLFRMELKFREQRSEGIQTVPEVANLVFSSKYTVLNMHAHGYFFYPI